MGGLETLAEAIEDLEIPPEPDALVEAFGLRDRLSAKLASAVGAFDAAGGWDADAATSLIAWLRSRAEMTSKEAARVGTTARRLRQLPVTAKAWTEGAISGGQVEAIMAGVGSHVALFATQESAVVPALVELSVPDTARAMQTWRALATADGVAPDEPSGLHMSKTLNGRYAFAGELDSVGGETVITALRVAEEPDRDGDSRRTPATRRAEALVEVCRFFLDHQAHRPGRRHRPHLNVVVNVSDAEDRGPGRFVDGGHVDPLSLQVLLCDSAICRVVCAGPSAILDYGTSTRTIPGPLWNAIILRDGHCRFPGCDRPASWCDAHHVVPVIEGGPTCLANCCLLCRRHHRRLHQHGWHAKLRADGTLEVTDPSGRVRTSRPPGVVTARF